jgi:hypothetical protein
MFLPQLAQYMASPGFPASGLSSIPLPVQDNTAVAGLRFHAWRAAGVISKCAGGPFKPVVGLSGAFDLAVVFVLPVA